MSDSRVVDAPDSPDSVGWIMPRKMRLASPDAPFRLESGEIIADVEVEYETYGELSPAAPPR